MFSQIRCQGLSNDKVYGFSGALKHLQTVSVSQTRIPLTRNQSRMKIGDVGSIEIEPSAIAIGGGMSISLTRNFKNPCK